MVSGLGLRARFWVCIPGSMFAAGVAPKILDPQSPWALGGRMALYR